MVQLLRWLAAVAVVAVATGAAPADSGRAADRAGQQMGPGKAEQDRQHRERLLRWDQWLALREREMALRRVAAEAFLKWWVGGDRQDQSGDGPPPGQ